MTKNLRHDPLLRFPYSNWPLTDDHICQAILSHRSTGGALLIYPVYKFSCSQCGLSTIGSRGGREELYGFYIRIDDSQNLRDAIKDIPEMEWVETIINNKKVEVAETPFQPFGAKKTYRAVVKRRKRKDGQYDVFIQSPYAYYAIMTSNEKPEATPEWVTRF
ncbi:MAG: hypothetical protein ABIN89_08745 [Chitinophagaceae bacterium]